jgi:aminoglycoside 6'-N-acetyltransferase I
MIHVRPVANADAADWLCMRRELWPDGYDSHTGEIARYFAGELRLPLEVLVAVDPNGTLMGFVELSVHPYAEGCVTDRVAYLEGWYVKPEMRLQGVGRALIAASEQWARTQGCTEFASDAAVDNEISAAAHQALGFEDVAHVRCFRKLLIP